jgi:hypothetical protein
MRTHFCITIVAILASSRVCAGDACGEVILFSDIGVPQYADRTEALSSEPLNGVGNFSATQDPIAATFAVMLANKERSCFGFEHRYTPQTNGDLSGDMLDENNRFQCHDAHIELGHQYSLRWLRQTDNEKTS